VLDVGIGTGTLAKRLYDDGYTITGLDFSEKMLDASAQKMPEALLLQHDFSEGLPETLQSMRFDAVVCTYAIHHLDDLQKASLIRQLRALLAPGGQLLIGDIAFDTFDRMMECQSAYADAWDYEECYPVMECLQPLCPGLSFEQVGICAGIFSIEAEPAFNAEEFCRRAAEACGLGALLAPPRPLTGGLMHKMYELCAEGGRFAIKLLNPHIMKRPEAMGNFRTAEALEMRLEQARLPVLTACTFFGRRMQELDGQYYYIFPWFEGSSVRGGAITPAHCAAVGSALARIHAVERRQEPYSGEPAETDWALYADALTDSEPELAAWLSGCLAQLNACRQRGNEALARMEPCLAICHNDMDPKNVLWQGMDMRIIDLECLTWASPFMELYELALCWCGFEEGAMDFERLECFLSAYFAAGGKAPADWAVLHDANMGRLGWLEYNLKRVLGIEASPDEAELGRAESFKTLGQIEYYEAIRPVMLERCLQLSCSKG